MKMPIPRSNVSDVLSCFEHPPQYMTTCRPFHMFLIGDRVVALKFFKANEAYSITGKEDDILASQVSFDIHPEYCFAMNKQKHSQWYLGKTNDVFYVV